MKMPIFDNDGGEKVGDMEIPDDVIEAALKLGAWLEANYPSMRLYGLQLVDDF